MIIVLEGFDKSGKTTIKNALNKATNFEHVLIDRGPWSCMFFDSIIRDDEHLYLMHRQDALRMAEVVDLVVYCKCEKELAIQRHEEVQEEVPEYFKRYEANSNLYQIMIESTTNETLLIIPTDDFSVEQCVNAIKEFIEENYRG